MLAQKKYNSKKTLLAILLIILMLICESAFARRNREFKARKDHRSSKHSQVRKSRRATRTTPTNISRGALRHQTRKSRITQNRSSRRRTTPTNVSAGKYRKQVKRHLGTNRQKSRASMRFKSNSKRRSFSSRNRSALSSSTRSAASSRFRSPVSSKRVRANAKRNNVSGISKSRTRNRNSHNTTVVVNNNNNRHRKHHKQVRGKPNSHTFTRHKKAIHRNLHQRRNVRTLNRNKYAYKKHRRHVVKRRNNISVSYNTYNYGTRYRHWRYGRIVRRPYRHFRRRRVFRHIVRPKHRFVIAYHGPYFSFRYVYPHYHRKYVFVSVNGYWPRYRYVRYYRYGCHPYRWYGYYPDLYRVEGDTYNYYTYNYYGDEDEAAGNGYEEETLERAKKEYEITHSGEPEPETYTDRLFNDGVEAFEKGFYATAADKFYRAMRESPQDKVLPFAYIQALFADERYIDAVEKLRNTLEDLSKDEQPGLFYPRGLYPDDRVLQNQINDLEKKTKTSVNFKADYELLLGYHLLGIEKYDEAIIPLQSASEDYMNADAADYLLDMIDKILVESDPNIDQ